MNLYIVHLGYYDADIGIYELHTNMHVVAQNVQAAKEAIKNNPIYQSKKMHIDGIEELLTVDGYTINVVKNDEALVENKKFDYNMSKMLS